MKLQAGCLRNANRLRSGGESGYTLVETLIAFGIYMLLLAAAMAFIWFSAIAVSGITAQSAVNQQAGYTFEFIQSRVRFATFITNDVSGNILTLGFDDDYTNDSSGDHITYNDQNHFERFQFIGVNSTNIAACATNRLVYFPNITVGASNTMIPAGVRNLPGYNLFLITNKVIAVIRFGVVDTYSRDHYQGIDVQGTAISLNRASNTNVLSILP